MTLICLPTITVCLSLDELAIKFGTDKSSKFHNYTAIYENYFSSIKDKPLVFVEIGFGRGNSTYMWEAYFPNAEIHIIDINRNDCFSKYGKKLSSRCTLHQADQANPEQLHEIMRKIGKEVDILIDDGGHTMKQQLVSFNELFPYIKTGGLYVIEDLHTSYSNKYKQYFDLPNGQTMINYLKNLVDEVNFVGKMSGLANKQTFNKSLYTSYYQQHIHSLHFYTSLCFIFKI